MIMKKYIFPFLFIIALMTFQQKGQAQCDQAYLSLNDFSTLVRFGLASGPGHFSQMFESSNIGNALGGCPSFADTAWQEIAAMGQLAQSQFANDPVELKTAALIVAFRANLSPANTQLLKDFVKTSPWTTGMVFPAHLAVDLLLEINNDPKQDTAYRTYSIPEMEEALQKYAQ